MKYIQLTQGKKVIVDDIDFDFINQYKFHYEKKWKYARRMSTKRMDGYGRKIIFLHQDIARRKYGNYDTKKYKVDHINRNTLDCRRENIRLVTSAESCQNRGLFKNKTQGRYVGVSLRPKHRWQARITFNKKTIHLGSFDTEKEAVTAYNKKAKELYGKYAHINTIEEKVS